jgi:hypothetical protein
VRKLGHAISKILSCLKLGGNFMEIFRVIDICGVTFKGVISFWIFWLFDEFAGFLT